MAYINNMFNSNGEKNMTDVKVKSWIQHSFSRHTGGDVEVLAWHYETCPISGMKTAIMLTARVNGEPVKARYAHKEWLVQGDADSFSDSTPTPSNSGYGRK